MRIYDANQNTLESVYDRLNDDLNDLYVNGLIMNKKLKGRVVCTNAIVDAVRNVDLIIECIVEDPDIKANVLSTISRLASPHTIIATNTVSLDLKQLVEHVVYKERFLGLRFLYPVYCMTDVELTTTSLTSIAVIDRIRLALSDMDKTLFYRKGKTPVHLTPTEIAQQNARRKDKLNLEFYLTYGVKQKNVETDEYRPKPVSHIAEESSENQQSATSLNLTCAICLESPRNAIFTPCNHLVSCYDCSKRLHACDKECPICRQKINEVIRIYIP